MRFCRSPVGLVLFCLVFTSTSCLIILVVVLAFDWVCDSIYFLEFVWFGCLDFANTVLFLLIGLIYSLDPVLPLPTICLLFVVHLYLIDGAGLYVLCL